MEHKQLRRGRRKLVAVLTGMILVGAGCGGDSDQGAGGEAGAEAELRRVTFSAATCGPYYYQMHVALHLGLFEEEGLDVEMQCTDGSSAVAQQLAAGNAETGGAGTAAILPSIAAGTPLYPFMITDYGLAYDLVVPTDSDIQSISDLDGKAIGVSALEGAEVPVIRGLLAEAGVDPDRDAQLVEVGVDPAVVRVALERGRIDAVGATAGDLGILKNSGIDIRSVIPEEQKEQLSNIPSGALLATEEVADDHEMLGAFGRAAAKGFLIGYVNPEATICIMTEVIPEEFVDRDAGVASYEGALEFTTAPLDDEGNYQFSFGNNDVELWNDYVELYANGGVISEPFDMEPYIVDVNEEINDFDQAEWTEFAESLQADC